MLNGTIGCAYNISSPYGNIKLVDFARLISEIANVNLKIDAIGEPGGSIVTNTVIDCCRLLSIGWYPIYDITEGIKRTLMIMRSYEN